ncbi:hypothetical protein Moror_11823 [Moniliophthora roreri MCA 2997]|uniref:Uncharacterized protein n=1 Tax=Moniliophthora roreri (strain MCA 2997) TaxID=1381753 RepID=V2WRU1_MONRO|nr:hypothetical protein Moror_11823 [Moniliophthora roreri MCA 2997]
MLTCPNTQLEPMFGAADDVSAAPSTLEHAYVITFAGLPQPSTCYTKRLVHHPASPSQEPLGNLFEAASWESTYLVSELIRYDIENPILVPWRLRAWETGSGVPPGPHGHSGTIGSVPGLSGGVLRDSGHLRLHDDDVYHIKRTRYISFAGTPRLQPMATHFIDLVHCSPTTYDRQAFLVYRLLDQTPATGR